MSDHEDRSRRRRSTMLDDDDRDYRRKRRGSTSSDDSDAESETRYRHENESKRKRVASAEHHRAAPRARDRDRDRDDRDSHRRGREASSDQPRAADGSTVPVKNKIQAMDDPARGPRNTNNGNQGGRNNLGRPGLMRPPMMGNRPMGNQWQPQGPFFRPPMGNFGGPRPMGPPQMGNPMMIRPPMMNMGRRKPFDGPPGGATDEYDPEKPSFEGRPLPNALGGNNRRPPAVDSDQRQVNAAVAASLGVKVGDCFRFAKTGTCMNGDSCNFSHNIQVAPRPAGIGIRAPPSMANTGDRQTLHQSKSTNPSRLLEVQNIPKELNNMGKLSEHFCKFGNVVAIRCGKNAHDHRDLRAAVVEYSTASEAIKAHGDANAILGNRFIIANFALAGGNPKGQGGSNVSGKGSSRSFNQSFSASMDARRQSKKDGAASLSANAKPFVSKAAAAAKKAAAQSNSEEIQKMLALQKQEQVMLQKLNAQQKSLMAKAKNPKLNKEAKTQILKTLVKLNKIIKLKMGTMKASMEAVSAAGSTVTRKQPATLSVAKVSTTKLAAVESDSDAKQDDTQEAAVAEVGYELAIVGLPETADAAAVAAHFQVYGKVLAFESAQGQGESMVSFKEQAAAQKALDEVKDFGDHVLSISWLKESNDSAPAESVAESEAADSSKVGEEKDAEQDEIDELTADVDLDDDFDGDLDFSETNEFDDAGDAGDGKPL